MNFFIGMLVMVGPNLSSPDTGERARPPWCGYVEYVTGSSIGVRPAGKEMIQGHAVDFPGRDVLKSRVSGCPRT